MAFPFPRAGAIEVDGFWLARTVPRRQEVTESETKTGPKAAIRPLCEVIPTPWRRGAEKYTSALDMPTAQDAYSMC